MRIHKAHAYGNDFLLVPEEDGTGDRSALARAVCDRHRGLGADGLILYAPQPHGASMTLFNADGSPAELSGNGLRCLAALIAHTRGARAGAQISIATDAGRKTLELLEHADGRWRFRAAMGRPEGLREIEIPLPGETITASVLAMGNPQCVVLGRLPDAERFARLGPALATHALFPAGTNVEFAEIDAPDRIRILIWERGVGPTSSSGTGTCAAAVAAAAHGGAARAVEVVAPGGTQHVDWRDEAVYLTGWAEIVLEGRWIGPAAR